MKSDIIARAAHATLSLPNTILAPLALRRPRVDGQRLSPRLQLISIAARQALKALRFPPTASQLHMDAAVGWPSLAHVHDARHRDLTLRGPDGGSLRARLYEPESTAAPGLVLFMHGGGWQLGSIDSYDGVCAFLAKTAGLKVLSLDYRLSWQARFPAAFDDVVAAFRDVVDRADEFGVAPDRIALAGDSAGGNLAAAAALALANDPAYRPALAVLIYPCVDGDLDRYESAHLFQATLDREIVHRDMRRYAPSDTDLRDPRFAVMAAADLSAMPPTYIATAGMDVLRDQGEALGARLRECGVDATTRRFTNLPHGFLSMLVDPDARQAATEIALAVKHLQPPG